MAEDYYWVDCMTAEGTCMRFHLLWQRMPEKAESDGNCHPMHVRGLDYTPLDPDIIRECYKFMYAPSVDEEINPLLYQPWCKNVHCSQIQPENLCKCLIPFRVPVM